MMKYFDVREAQKMALDILHRQGSVSTAQLQYAGDYDFSEAYEALRLAEKDGLLKKAGDEREYVAPQFFLGSSAR